MEKQSQRRSTIFCQRHSSHRHQFEDTIPATKKENLNDHPCRWWFSCHMSNILFSLGSPNSNHDRLKQTTAARWPEETRKHRHILGSAVFWANRQKMAEFCHDLPWTLGVVVYKAFEKIAQLGVLPDIFCLMKVRIKLLSSPPAQSPELSLCNFDFD